MTHARRAGADISDNTLETVVGTFVFCLAPIRIKVYGENLDISRRMRRPKTIRDKRVSNHGGAKWVEKV